MTEMGTDQRQTNILLGAWNTFATYGYKKTSMDDIARAAGMSRPALYLHYRNKEDIFRSLTEHFYEVTAHELEAALAEEGSVAERISAAFAAQGGQLVKDMLTSPHGRELLESGKSISNDVALAGEERLKSIYAEWLRKEDRAGRVQLSAEAESVAATITAALKGLKMVTMDYPAYQQSLANLASLFGAGLTRRD